MILQGRLLLDRSQSDFLHDIIDRIRFPQPRIHDRAQPAVMLVQFKLPVDVLGGHSLFRPSFGLSIRRWLNRLFFLELRSLFLSQLAWRRAG